MKQEIPVLWIVRKGTFTTPLSMLLIDNQIMIAN